MYYSLKIRIFLEYYTLRLTKELKNVIHSVKHYKQNQLFVNEFYDIVTKKF